MDLSLELDPPGPYVAHSFPRFTPTTSTVLASGVLRLVAVAVKGGLPINRVAVVSAGTGYGTPTNQWACLIDPVTMAVLSKSTDRTTEAFNANSLKIFTGLDYTPPEDGWLYVGVLVKATSMGNLIGASVSAWQSIPSSAMPVLTAESSTGLTNPASFSGPAIMGAAQSAMPYVALRSN